MSYFDSAVEICPISKPVKEVLLIAKRYTAFRFAGFRRNRGESVTFLPAARPATASGRQCALVLIGGGTPPALYEQATLPG